jgi:hypothetical protein
MNLSSTVSFFPSLLTLIALTGDKWKSSVLIGVSPFSELKIYILLLSASALNEESKDV